jgi:hypothetical protein
MADVEALVATTDAAGVGLTKFQLLRDNTTGAG